MSELKNSAVKDGLHVYGKVPEGKCFDNLMRMMVRVRNGNIPSLNDSMLTAEGYEPERIKDAPTEIFDGVSGSTIYDGAVEAAKRLTASLAEHDFASDAVDCIIKEEKFPGPTTDLKQVLLFMCDVVKGKLEHITDEMDHLVAGTNGRFVPPALGGNPTRGNVSILPTGRNFYASDPEQIPSRAAWEIGGKLAKQMLAQYDAQESGYPEGLLWWYGLAIH